MKDLFLIVLLKYAKNFFFQDFFLPVVSRIGEKIKAEKMQAFSFKKKKKKAKFGIKFLNC